MSLRMLFGDLGVGDKVSLGDVLLEHDLAVVLNCCCFGRFASFLGFHTGDPIGGVEADALVNFSGLALAKILLSSF